MCHKTLLVLNIAGVVRHKFPSVGHITAFVHHKILADEHITEPNRVVLSLEGFLASLEQHGLGNILALLRLKEFLLRRKTQPART